MAGDIDQDAQARTRELLAKVRARHGTACHGCGARLCGHAVVMSLVLGYQQQPRCAPCLAAELREPVAALCERTLQWVQRRDCFLRGWLWASAAEGLHQALRPSCLAFPATATTTLATTAPGPGGGDWSLHADATWDGGDLGCGDLVLELRLRMLELQPGAVLQVHAMDPGAPLDLPAWCGLTGHTMLKAQHPDYWILRRDDALPTTSNGAQP